MRALLSLAVAAVFSIPAAAQTASKSDVVLGSRGEVAFMVSTDKTVESRVAYAGYIFDKAELDATNNVEYSDGYDIRVDGLFYDYSVHAPSRTEAWDGGALRDLEWAVKMYEKRGKKKAQAELTDRADGIARELKALSTQRNMDKQSAALEGIKSRIPTATEGILQLIVARDMDRLEAQIHQ